MKEIIITGGADHISRDSHSFDNGWGVDVSAGRSGLVEDRSA